MKYSPTLRKKIKYLYLKGFLYYEIGKKIGHAYMTVNSILARMTFLDSDLDFVERELERVEKRYERLVDYSLPIEKSLEKRWHRMRCILKRYNRIKIYA